MNDILSAMTTITLISRLLRFRTPTHEMLEPVMSVVFPSCSWGSECAKNTTIIRKVNVNIVLVDGTLIDLVWERAEDDGIFDFRGTYWRGSED